MHSVHQLNGDSGDPLLTCFCSKLGQLQSPWIRLTWSCLLRTGRLLDVDTQFCLSLILIHGSGRLMIGTAGSGSNRGIVLIVGRVSSEPV